eukprot:COSAG04_NODE_5765_length_1499_cov_1.166429_4_plen_83_part_01
MQAQSQRPSAESLTLKGEIPVAAIKSVQATVSEEPEGDHLLTLDTSLVRCPPPPRPWPGPRAAPATEGRARAGGRWLSSSWPS